MYISCHIFGGMKRIPDTEIKALMISGGAAALQRNSSKPMVGMVSPCLPPQLLYRKPELLWTHTGQCSAGSRMWPSLHISSGKEPQRNWRCPLRWMIWLFTFPGSSNVSHWLTHKELEVTFTHTSPGEGVVNPISFDQEMQNGAGELSLQCLVTPKDHKGAGVWIGGSPHSMEHLRTRLRENYNTNLMPHVTFQLDEINPHMQSKAGCSVYALFETGAGHPMDRRNCRGRGTTLYCETLIIWKKSSYDSCEHPPHTVRPQSHKYEYKLRDYFE